MNDAEKSMENSTPSHDVFRVGVRVPPFWPEKPEIWFAQVEGQFAISNITADTTKFYYVVSNLDTRYSTEVEDIIVNPPVINKYEKLKTELIKRLSESREKKVHQLLTHEELGDRKPSQFLRHLQHLTGPKVPEEFLRTIWSSRLPANIKSIIASQVSARLEELADLADRIHDVMPTSRHVASTTTTQPDLETMSRQITDLTKQVQLLTEKLDQNNVSRSGRSNSRDDNNARSRRQSRSHSRNRYQKYTTCWYHYKFGAKATKCTQPCDFTVQSENCKSSQ